MAYKYKPTIQYSVELFRSQKDGADGRLRIQLRTQSQDLLRMLDQFFRFWVLMEQRYTAGAAEYRIAPGRMERTLRNPSPDNAQQFGELIERYISRLDRDIKTYFAGASSLQETLAELESRFYREMQQEMLHI